MAYPAHLVGIAISSALLLAGCASTRAEPPAPTVDELEQFTQHAVLTHFGTDAAQARRPGADAAEVEIVEPTGIDVSYVECLNKAGFTGYYVAYFGTIVLSNPQGSTVEQRLQRSSCQFDYAWALASTSMLTRAERDYLYDYYQERLVPCLRTAGFSIERPPSRKSFVDDWLQPVWWSPYDAMRPAASTQEWTALHVECPALPPVLAARVSS